MNNNISLLPETQGIRNNFPVVPKGYIGKVDRQYLGYKIVGKAISNLYDPNVKDKGDSKKILKHAAAWSLGSFSTLLVIFSLAKKPKDKIIKMKNKIILPILSLLSLHVGISMATGKLSRLQREQQLHNNSVVKK